MRVGEVVGHNVRRWRQARRLSATALASAALLERNTLNRIEYGEREARAEELLVLAAALGCSVVDLLLPLDGEGRRTVVDLPGGTTLDPEAMADLLLHHAPDRPESEALLGGIPQGEAAYVRRYVDMTVAYLEAEAVVTEQFDFLDELADQLESAASSVRASRRRIKNYDEIHEWMVEQAMGAWEPQDDD